MAFDIVSLRETEDGSWLALILEGERLGQFRFISQPALAEAVMRDAIHALATTFVPGESALDQLHERERAHASGTRIRRVVDVTPPLAAAA